MHNTYNEKGIISHSEGTQLPNYDTMKNIEDEEGHLVILEADRLRNLEMKEKVRKEYFLVLCSH